MGGQGTKHHGWMITVGIVLYVTLCLIGAVFALSSPKSFRLLGTPSDGVVPAVPTLNSLASPDTDGSYTISWSAVPGATSYTLVEDDNAVFSSSITTYNGASTTVVLSSRTNGDYYYRVKASNAYGSGSWSSIQPITVDIWPPTPGTYRPGPTTTGVRPGQSLTDVYDSDDVLKIYGSGSGLTTITNKRYRCWVKVYAANGKLKFSNCEFVGGQASTTTNNSLVWVDFKGPADSVVFEDCTFVPASPNFQVDGIKGRGFTVRRCNNYGSVDTYSLQGDNIIIEDSWSHDLSWFPVPDNGPDYTYTHNDNAQWHYGSNIEIRYSFFDDWISTPAAAGGYGNASIMGTMVNPAVYGMPQDSLRVHHCWLRGGASVINIYATHTAALAGYRITGIECYNNTIEPFPGKYQILISSDVEVDVLHDNFLPNGVTPATVKRWVAP
jgi:hypothetical protein